MAAFLASVESEEALLLQRLRDRENGVMRDRLLGVDEHDGHARAADSGDASPEGSVETYEIYGEF